jgi:RNA polymerase sigma factor (sigma-70 family)
MFWRQTADEAIMKGAVAGDGIERRGPQPAEPAGAPVCLELSSDSTTSPARLVDREALYKELLPRILGLRAHLQRGIPARFQNVIGVDDLLQEISIAAYRTFPSFHPVGRDALGRWLATIADAKLTDALRLARAQKRGGGRRLLTRIRRGAHSFCDLLGCLRSAQRSPSRSAHSGEVVRLVQDALESLTGARRTAMRMYYVDGLPVGDVARNMNRTVPAVNSLLYFGRCQLRDVLGDAGRFFTDASSNSQASVGA